MRENYHLRFDPGRAAATSARLYACGLHNAGEVAAAKRRAIEDHPGDLQRATQLRNARIAERFECGVDEVDGLTTTIGNNTGRLTLYQPDMDPEPLIEAMQLSPQLHDHVTRVLRVYIDAGSDFAEQFLGSPAGIALCDAAGFVRHDGDWLDRATLPLCRNCDEPIFPGDIGRTRVYTTTECITARSYLVHDGCAGDGNEFQCEVSGIWFDDEQLTRATTDDTDETVCVEYCLEHDLIAEGEDDDGDCASSSVRSGSPARRSFTVYYRDAPRARVVGYHRAPRPWATQPEAIPNGAIGVELELGFPDGPQRLSAFMRKWVDPDGRHLTLPFSFEHDGSLDRVPGGIEIVSDPLPLHAGYQAEDAPWRVLLSDLRKGGAAGWRYRQDAGIHVNLCVCDESRASVYKYAAFISTAAAMSKLIAGRKRIFNADDANNGYYRVAPQLLRGERAMAAMDRQFAHGKYSAVNRRNRDCLETRIFGSNIRYEGFMACVEYCVAVMEFVRPLHILDVSSPTIAAEFRNWLGGRTLQFPNLATRLGIVPHVCKTAVPATSHLHPQVLAA